MKRPIILSLLLCSLVSIAEARTLPLVSPKANDAADPISCWKWQPIGGGNNTIGLQRVCPGTFAVDFPLAVDNSGTYSVVVTAARATTSGQVTCQTYTSTSTGGYTPGRPITLAGSSTAFQTMDLGPTSVSDGGTLWIRCLISQNSRLLQVDYNWTGF